MTSVPPSASDAAPPSVDPPPKKRSIFKRTRSAQAGATGSATSTPNGGANTADINVNGGDDDADLFSRGRSAIHGIWEEKQRREREKAERKEREKKARREAKEAEKRERKRRRADGGGGTEERSSGDFAGGERDGAQWDSGVGLNEPSSAVARNPNSLAQRYDDVIKAANTSAKSPPNQDDVIALDDDEDDYTSSQNLPERPYDQLHNNTATNATRYTANSDKSSDVEETDDLAYLTRLAREERRQREQDARIRALQLPQQQRSTGSRAASLALSPTGEGDGEEDDDPIVAIYIDSQLPGTMPLIVKRHLSQKLGVVRQAWCESQGMSGPQTQSVFLTWRNRRLWDFSSCRSLGIDVNDYRDGLGGDGFSISEDCVDVNPVGEVHLHFEAVNKDIFEENKKRALKPKGEEAAQGGEIRAGTDAYGKTEAKEQETHEKAKVIRIILKGKGYNDFKLSVKPDTMFERIAEAFRREREVPHGHEIKLLFDGDQLMPGDMMQDTEIEDMDTVDVVTRSR
ncbi:ubiquitin-2 like Rad60 SUMO-like-domain-containing protein [Lineolata rhizophorae]|uniref:Ubiquitin-2 like Rad60 SUMO-like-domain-containing protein n=1 Tax=Lineolata rhizophorae TaxID=578093 RepID=A0A6A6NUD5_9PEZI|nr:ubiquitin-2 like Rad60 SUMO-like-domain-containing protein [Lineolata rhizophorae]